MAIGLGISIGVLGIMPKKFRDTENIPNMVAAFSIIAAIIISLVLLDMTDWVQPIINFIINQWNSLISTGNIGWFVILGIAFLVIFYLVLKSESNKMRGGPGGNP